MGRFHIKKMVALCLAIIFLIIAPAGCSRRTAEKYEESLENGEIAALSSEEINKVTVTPDSSIQSLEKGLSAVRYNGDYAFDDFLAQGGATSDRGVFEFLTSYFLSKSYHLQIKEDMFGCSCIYVQSTDGGYLFGRNFDWRNCDARIVTVYPKNGYKSISTVNMDFIRQGVGAAASLLPDQVLIIGSLYAPLDGMNEKGLCVAVNMIKDSATINQDSEKPDITTTTAIRLMLDKAANVNEALDLLKSYDLHASMNYMIHFAIADAEGNSVAVEFINNEMVVTETPVLTNFYLAEGEKYGIGTQQSHTRFDILTDALEENAQMTPGMVRDTLSSVSKDNFKGFESTEWSVVFNQSDLTACYYHREDYTQEYYFSLEVAN